MITYEEALEIAQTYDEEIGHCEEYEKTYVFEVITSEETTGPQPLVVLKETGEAIPFPAFLSKGIDMGEKLGDWMIHVDLKPPRNIDTTDLNPEMDRGLKALIDSVDRGFNQEEADRINTDLYSEKESKNENSDT